ncbi:MAG: TldD/PmbA family protein [Chloroflexi bacterium]|nr:TldD/PmbA family protein [Chloroflexota bacterium]
MEDLLAKAMKVAQEAEVFSYSRTETPILFEANRLKSLQTRESKGTALRIIRDGRVGFAATTRLGDEASLVEMAREVLPFGPEARLTLPSPGRYPAVEVYDQATPAVPIEKMAALGDALIARLRQANSEILCEAGVSALTAAVVIVNSHGARAEYRKTAFGISIEGTLIRGTDMLFVGDGESSCHPVTNIDNIAKEVERQLELARDIAPAPTGKLPVILTPHGVRSALIMPLAVGFNGKTVLQGASPIGDKLGQRVFDPRLSIWDDPTIPYQPQSRPCDDEGVPSQRTPLAEGGVVANFLYDLQTAAQAGKKSTGNGSRSLGSLPSPSMTAFVIGEGDVSFEDMVSDIKEGLVVEQLMGATQGNVTAGEFSGNVLLGYKIEKGKLVGRVKDTMVSGNIYEALKDIVALGRESRWVGSSLRTPAICFRALSVAGKG